MRPDWVADIAGIRTWLPVPLDGAITKRASRRLRWSLKARDVILRLRFFPSREK